MPTEPTKPNSVYPDAYKGRLKNVDTPPPEEARIISKDVDGSKEYERSKEFIREEEYTRLDDKLRFLIIFMTVIIGILAILSRMIGSFFPYYKQALILAIGLLIAFIVYYLIRRSKIKKDSKKFKDNKSN